MGVDDGERYSLGEVTLEFRHTPGHTPESLSHRGLRARRRRRSVRRADRRCPVHRRRGSARPAGVDRLHPRGAGRQALRLAARQADDAARRDPGVSGPRRGFGVREEPVHRLVVDDRRAEGDELCPARPRQGDVHGARHRGAAAGAGLLRLRRDPQPQGPRAAGREQAADADDLRAGAECDRRRRRAGRWPQPRGVRPGPSAPRHQHRARGPLRRVRRLGAAARRRHRAVHRTRPGTRGQEPARPNRFRPGDRLPRVALQDDVRPPGRHPGRIAVDGQGVRRAGRRRSPICRSSTSATRARSRPGRSRTRSPSRWASCPRGSANSTPACRPSCTAPAATGRRWRRACCGTTASPTSATSWAATTPGTETTQNA